MSALIFLTLSYFLPFLFPKVLNLDYDIPHVSRRKRKLTGVDKTVSPSAKKVKVNPTSPRDNEDCVITGTETPAVF